MTPLLDVRELCLEYADRRGNVRAVDSVSFVLDGPGQALGVVGESGSGKSSLVLSLMRMLPRSVANFGGQVYLSGREVAGLADEPFRREVRWRQIALVPQGAMNGFNPVIRVGEQIVEPAVANGHLRPRDAGRRARELLERVGLPAEVYGRYPHELSGGMKQRAMIAAALILSPPLVLMDEPTSALDVSVQAQITNLLKDLKREMGTTIIFVTHDIALASDVCDFIAVMYAGRLVETGPAEQVLVSPAHPYTQKLLDSIPRLRDDTVPAFIPGAPPDLHDPPRGCKFHPRCPYVFDRCRVEEPPDLAAGPGQRARCWLVEG